MNKEYEFRVYEPLNKTIEYLNFALYGSDSTYNRFVLPTGNQLKNYTFMNLDAVEIMQYVRVKDKNEKKVFEGDIVRCWGGEYYQGYWEHNDIIVVDSIDNPFTMMELTESEYIEVIGDIYRNKDLLERCKNKIV